MALYIPHSIFYLARLLYVRPETFGPYYVHPRLWSISNSTTIKLVTATKETEVCIPLMTQNYLWKHILEYSPHILGPSVQIIIYRVCRGECDRLREKVSCVKVHRYYPKHLYPKLNSYGDNGERKVWSSCGSTYCTCFAWCYPYTAHVRPSVSQPSQAHSAFIMNRCHSYSEL